MAVVDTKSGGAALRYAPAPQNPSQGSRVGADDGGQWAALAGLRFALAMVVLLGHVCQLIEGGRHDWTYIGLWLNQGSAVFGFMVLSGYSIAASLERGAAGYYQRRVDRIWPLYLLTVAVGVAVSCLIGGEMALPGGTFLPHPTMPELVGALLMLQTIATPTVPVIGQTWSLASEWWLYIAAPTFARIPSLALAGLAAVSFAAFLWLQGSGNVSINDLQRGEATAAMAWMWLSGFLYHRHRESRAAILWLLGPAIAAMYLGHFTGLPFLASLLALVACEEFRASRRTRSLLLWLGDLSYPLYLLQAPVLVLLAFLRVVSPAAHVAAALLAAALALHLVDYPLRRRAAGTRKSDARKSGDRTSSPRQR